MSFGQVVFGEVVVLHQFRVGDRVAHAEVNLMVFALIRRQSLSLSQLDQPKTSSTILRYATLRIPGSE